jgi:hypothetical protein
MEMARAVAVATGTGDAAISTSTPSRLMGWSVVETAGTPALASAVLRDGTGTGDPIVAQAKVAASGAAFQWFDPAGIVCPNGVFLDRTAGETTVVVYLA